MDTGYEEEIAAATRSFLATQKSVYEALTRHVDRRVLMHTLEHFKGNRVHAAAALGISRTRLRRKMRALGIRVGIEIERCKPRGTEKR